MKRAHLHISAIISTISGTKVIIADDPIDLLGYSIVFVIFVILTIGIAKARLKQPKNRYSHLKSLL